jgi:hypothetical protein
MLESQATLAGSGDVYGKGQVGRYHRCGNYVTVYAEGWEVVYHPGHLEFRWANADDKDKIVRRSVKVVPVMCLLGTSERISESLKRVVRRLVNPAGHAQADILPTDWPRMDAAVSSSVVRWRGEEQREPGSSGIIAMVRLSRGPCTANAYAQDNFSRCCQTPKEENPIP